MTRRGRAFLSGLAVAILFSLPLLPEIVGARRLVFRDAHMTHWPWRRVAMTALSEGKAPFVNETASGGQPFLANPNAGLLYPTVLFEKILPPAAAFNLHYLLHVLWAYFGARALATRFGLSEAAAFFSGVAYAFSGAMLSYASAFANAGPAAAWLPWVAAATIDVVRAEHVRRLAAAAAATGLAFGLQLLAGEPAISALTLLFAGVLAVAGWLGSGGDRKRRAVRILGGGLAAGVLAAGIAAPLLAPLLEVLPLTYRGQHQYSERAFGASPFALWRAAEWLFPRMNGDPGALTRGGHWQYRLHEGEIVYLWCVTFGILPLLLIALGAVRRSYWSSKTLLLAGTGLVTLLLSFGFAFPPYRLLYSVEFLRRLRYPIKFYLLTTLCVALLAGFGVEALRRRRGGVKEAAVLGSTLAFYAFALLAARDGGLLDRVVSPWVAALANAPEELLPTIRQVFRGDALIGLGACVLLGAVIFVRRPPRGSGHALGFAALLLALPWGLPLFVSADDESLSRPPALQAVTSGPGRLYASPELPLVTLFESGRMPRELPATFAKLARVQIEEMIPATGAAFGARYLFDEDPDGSYGWVNRIAGEVLTASSREERARLLRLFGARWVLAGSNQPLPGFRALTGFSVAGRQLVLHQSAAGVSPQLRWAGRVHRRASLSGALELARSDLFRPATDVVLPGRRDAPPAEPEARAAALEVERVEADRARVDVNAAAPGHVVFSRTFFPAWKARLDGQPARVLLANGRDLAVAVPAGRHAVEVFWSPTTFRVGVALQALAFLLALAVAVFELGRRGAETPA